MVDPAGVVARNALPVIGALEAAGVDPSLALRAAELTRSDFLDPDCRVPHDRVVKLWQAAEELTRDPDFGLRCSSLVRPGDLGVIEYVFRKSRTVGEGIHRVIRYFRVAHDVARFEMTERDGEVLLQHVLPGRRSLPRAPVDFILGNPVRLARSCTEPGLNPLKVQLDYPEPADTTLLERHFQCQLCFSSDVRGIVYRTTDLEVALVESDPSLCAVLDQHAQQVLDRLPRISTLSDRVRELLSSQLSGGSTDALTVAAHLRMSVRTLHRRLAEEGTSHKALLEELRREMCQSLLRRPDISISEVAFMVGFSEPSAFHRAYKRWTGMTPAQARTHGR